jgi:hypothetical protein
MLLAAIRSLAAVGLLTFEGEQIVVPSLAARMLDELELS